jgi:hypothetical protein
MRPSETQPKKEAQGLFIPLDDKEFIQSIKAVHSIRGDEERKQKLEELCNLNGDIYIGDGTESAVIVKNENPEVVVAVSYKDLEPIQAIQTFYIQKIMHTLFPYNFPTFQTSSGGQIEKGRLSGSRRQRIRKSNEPTQVPHPFVNVKQASQLLELPILWDRNSRNFYTDDFDNQYYLDRLTFHREGRFNIEEIKKYMTENNYSEPDIDKTLNAIHRVELYRHLDNIQAQATVNESFDIESYFHQYLTYYDHQFDEKDKEFMRTYLNQLNSIKQKNLLEKEKGTV